MPPRELGAETRLLDLRMADLPMYNPDAEPDEHVARVLADVTWAQAFVLASPDYHGTMSGAMKNFPRLPLVGIQRQAVRLSLRIARKRHYGHGRHASGRSAMLWLESSLWHRPSTANNDFADSERNINIPARNRSLRMTARDMVAYGSLFTASSRRHRPRNTPDTFAAKYS